MTIGGRLAKLSHEAMHSRGLVNPTEAQWRRRASRWRHGIAWGSVYLVLGVGGLAHDSGYTRFFVGPALILQAALQFYGAGLNRAEHDRLQGRFPKGVPAGLLTVAPNAADGGAR